MAALRSTSGVVPRESNGFACALNHSPTSSHQHTEEIELRQVLENLLFSFLREAGIAAQVSLQLFRSCTGASPWPGARKLRKNGRNAEAYCTPLARERWVPRSCLLTSLLRCR